MVFRYFLFSLWYGCMAHTQGRNPDHECAHWNGAFYIDGHCYKVFNETLPWQKAQEACERSQPTSRLAELVSDDILREIRIRLVLMESDLFKGSQSIWLGGYFINGVGAVWSSNNITVTLSSSHGLDLRGHQTTDMCMRLSSSYRIPSLAACDGHAQYICQRDVKHPCTQYGAMSRYHEGSCYTFHTDKFYREASRTFCSTLDGKLAEPTTEEALDFVQNEVRYRFNIRIVLPSNGSVSTRKFGLPNSRSFSFTLQACGQAVMTFPVLTNENQPASETLRIVFRNKAESLMEKIVCTNEDNDRCETTSKSFKPLQHCERLQTFSIYSNENYVTLYNRNGDPSVTMYARFSTTISLDRAILSMDSEGHGEWHFEDPSFDVFALGGNDLDQEGSFVWESSETEVALPQKYWVKGEPNGDVSENYLSLWHVEKRLNDVSDGRPALPICQTAVELHFHLVLIPNDSIRDVVHVSANVLDNTVAVLLDGMFLTSRGTWVSIEELSSSVTRDQPFIFEVNSFRRRYAQQGYEDSAILLQSTDDVSVVVYSQTRNSYITSRLIFPSDIFSTEYIAYPYFPGDSIQIKTVAMDDGSTALRMRASLPRDTTIHDKDRYLYNDDGNTQTELLQHQRTASRNLSFDKGTLVFANKSIGVFVTSTSTKKFCNPPFFSSLPLDKLSTMYFTVPSSVQMLDSWTNQTIVITAAFENTLIQTNDPKVPKILLTREGDVTYIDLPSNVSHQICGSQPFLIAHTGLKRNGFCDCSPHIVPPDLWRPDYRFTSPLNFPTVTNFSAIIVRENNHNSSLFLNGEVPVKMDCLPIAGTHMMTCWIPLEGGSYYLELSPKGERFLAYLEGTYSGGRFCHALGVDSTYASHDFIFDYKGYGENENVITTTSWPDVSSEDYTSAETLFPKDETTDSSSLLYSSDHGEKSTSNGKVTDSTNQEGESTSSAFSNSITALTTNENKKATTASYMEVTTEGFPLTTKDISAQRKTDISRRSTVSPVEPATHDTYTRENLNDWNTTTSNKLNDTDVSTTWSTGRPTTVSQNSNKISNIPSVISTEKYNNWNMTCVSKPPCFCSLFSLNHFREHLAESLEIIQQLRLDARQTSAFKRTKISITDNRPSAVGVGLAGIAFIVPVVMLMVIPDFVQLAMYLIQVSKAKFAQTKV